MGKMTRDREREKERERVVSKFVGKKGVEAEKGYAKFFTERLKPGWSKEKISFTVVQSP